MDRDTKPCELHSIAQMQFYRVHQFILELLPSGKSRNGRCIPLVQLAMRDAGITLPLIADNRKRLKEAVITLRREFCNAAILHAIVCARVRNYI